MLLANLCLILSIAAPKVLAACKKSKPIIIDTDIFSSVDDIGALAVANVFHNRGKVDLLGVAVNTPSKYGAVAVDVGSFHCSYNIRLIFSLGYRHIFWKRRYSHCCDETVHERDVVR